jgi:hypothetical protein
MELSLNSQICDGIDVSSPMYLYLLVESSVEGKGIYLSSSIKTSMLIRSSEYADVNSSPV